LLHVCLPFSESFKKMNYSRLLSTTGLTVLSLVLASCLPIAEAPKTQTNLGLARISQNTKLISSQIMANFQSDSRGEVVVRPTVFDDIDSDLDNARSDLLTDTAKLLAGISVSDRSELTLLQDTQLWSEHRYFFDRVWSQLEQQQLAPLGEWGQQELFPIEADNSTIFYPFSNANFLQVYSLFPDSREYVLIGLEPVGNVPNLAYLSEKKLELELQKIRSCLDNIFPINNYFSVEQNRSIRDNFLALSNSEIDRFATVQALPMLYVFLAKTNNQIVSVEHIELDARGQIKKLERGMSSGVKITFVTQGSSQLRSLYYFSADLSNEALETNPELVQFLNRRQRSITYLEKAAYLMHFDSFSQIEDLILARSSYLLQDDSGVPIDVLKQKAWDLKFYGNYTQPLDLFKDKYQPELWQIYHSQNNIKPLTFSSGYQSQSDRSNLMLAKKQP
jgi:hypothetical protein